MDALQLQPLTATFGKAGLVAGTTTTISQANQIDYAIAGKMYRKAATTNEATPTVDFATGNAFAGISANQGTVYFLGRDSGGALRVVQGGVQALDVSGNFIQAPGLPAFPDGFSPFGYLVAKAGATAVGSWTLGANNMSGVTGLTYTFGDLSGFPARPIVS